MNQKQAIALGAIVGLSYGLAVLFGEVGIGVLLLGIAVVGLPNTVMCWRRTRLPLATAANAIADLLLVVVGVSLLAGRAIPEVLVAACVLPIGLLYAESKRSPGKWAAWKARVRGAGLVEILTGRHIPDLRHGVPESASPVAGENTPPAPQTEDASFDPAAAPAATSWSETRFVTVAVLLCAAVAGLGFVVASLSGVAGIAVLLFLLGGVGTGIAVWAWRRVGFTPDVFCLAFEAGVMLVLGGLFLRAADGTPPPSAALLTLIFLTVVVVLGAPYAMIVHRVWRLARRERTVG